MSVKWEYKLIKTDQTPLIERRINELGAEGWEAVGTVITGYGHSMGGSGILVKRPLPEPYSGLGPPR